MVATSNNNGPNNNSTIVNNNVAIPIRSASRLLCGWCMSLLLAAAAAATASNNGGSRHHRILSLLVSSSLAARVAALITSKSAVGLLRATRHHRPPRHASSSSSFASRANLESRTSPRHRRLGPPGIVMSPPNDGGVGSGGIRMHMSATAEGPPSGNDGGGIDATATTATTAARIARLVPATPSSLDLCGARLRSGLLVSFPTETVYGLGCHALDPDAIRKVFDAKERPLSDPLIVHVSTGADALGMWSASSSPAAPECDDRDDDIVAPSRMRRLRQYEARALRALTSSFFPGPLTVVARALPSVPSELMAGTGYVACRSPSHPVARELIRRAGVPIAAPSANKFGHVSPTRARHVMDDLGAEDVWIVDPGLWTEGGGENGDDDGDRGAADAATSAPPSGVCDVGVESTVVKVEMDPPSSSEEGGEEEGGVVGSITVLRHGAVSIRSIRASIDGAGLSSHFRVAESVRFTSEDTDNVAPGQTVRHYSPNVPCFMVGHARQRRKTGEEEPAEGAVEERRTLVDEEERSVLSRSVIIDYGGRLGPYRTHALAYRDLSPEGDPVAAASGIFEALRWSETIDGAIRVFVPELVLGGGDGHGAADDDGDDARYEIGALVLAVKDKLTRAASAVVVDKFE